MQEKIINLVKDNVMTIKIECGKTVDFHQHKMSFFKCPLLYFFEDPVKMKRCPYNMHISEIGSSDRLVLNQLFSRMNNTLVIDDHEFINAKEDDKTMYDPKDKWLLTVKIQGFKKSETYIRPIWKIVSMKKFDQ